MIFLGSVKWKNKRRYIEKEFASLIVLTNNNAGPGERLFCLVWGPFARFWGLQSNMQIKA